MELREIRTRDVETVSGNASIKECRMQQRLNARNLEDRDITIRSTAAGRAPQKLRSKTLCRLTSFTVYRIGKSTKQSI